MRRKPVRARAGRQTHLSRAETINFGAYYTAPEYVRTARQMLARNGVPKGAFFLDCACGYGGFLGLRRRNIAGCDIDPKAAARAKAENPHAAVHCADSLRNVSRKKFNIAENAPLVVVGNPPYNDKTSQIRRAVKTQAAAADADIKTRDAGLSFMRAFDKLRADIVCVLHPLSYLIKRANFSLLGAFVKNYALRDAEVFSSAAFPDNSRAISFPVVVALYVRDARGMSHDGVRRFRFRGGRADFAVDDFCYLPEFARKYPRKREKSDLAGIAFYPMRDINALRRNRTFLFSRTGGGVFIRREDLRYYIYADVFKRYARHVPYYFGNCDVMINEPLFRRCEKHFVRDALNFHPQLQKYAAAAADVSPPRKIEEYFRLLLGPHYQS